MKNSYKKINNILREGAMVVCPPATRILFGEICSYM